MRRICSRCLRFLGHVEPLDDNRRTDTYCRGCELRDHAVAETITAAEREELLGILREERLGMVTVTARVPAAVAQRLQELTAALEARYGGIQKVDVAGLALTRELHAVEDRDPSNALAIYRPLPLSFFAPHIAELRRPDDGPVTMFGHSDSTPRPPAPQDPPVEFFSDGGMQPPKENPAP